MNYRGMPNVSYHIAIQPKYRQNIVVSLRISEKTPENIIAEDTCGRWLAYVGMQNTDIGLAPLVICPVCPVTDGTEGTEP